MRYTSGYVLACSFLLILCAASRVHSHQAHESYPSEADWQWMNEHFGPAFERLMPLKRTVGTYVSYRSHRDLYTEVLEYSFLVGRDARSNGPGLEPFLSAHSVQADTVSVYDQMMKMHRQNPNEDAAAIESKVKIKKLDLTEKTCPAIQTQFRKFQQIRFGVPSFDVIVLHPLVHEFHIQTGAGDIDLSFRRRLTGGFVGSEN